MYDPPESLVHDRLSEIGRDSEVCHVSNLTAGPLTVYGEAVNDKTVRSLKCYPRVSNKLDQ